MPLAKPPTYPPGGLRFGLPHEGAASAPRSAWICGRQLRGQRSPIMERPSWLPWSKRDQRGEKRYHASIAPYAVTPYGALQRPF